MNAARIQWLHQTTNEGTYILYWMDASMRVDKNHALECAIQIANKHHKPVVVFVALPTQDTTLRHQTFVVEGLVDVVNALKDCHIGFVVKTQSPMIALPALLKDAHTLVMDFAYLKPQRAMRKEVYRLACEMNVSSVVVESNLIVPVRVTSDKEEYAAATIRRKVWKHVADFNDLNELTTVEVPWVGTLESDIDVDQWPSVIDSISSDHNVTPSPLYHGGYREALQRLSSYLQDVIFQDQPIPSDPAQDATSKLSMYLHYGHISPLEIMQRTLDFSSEPTPQMQANMDSFFEQLIVRRELAFNYCYYNQGYDVFDRMTEPWAYLTMQLHANDPKEYVYSLAQLETASTHDPYWNAAMLEMTKTGFMHNYMRMYWAKKIIEWSPSYEEAFARSIYLDDKYFLDGTDPNGYTGVAWCYGKHDRAWTERAIFGKLRYMNAAGLERKFKIQDYVKRWQ